MDEKKKTFVSIPCEPTQPQEWKLWAVKHGFVSRSDFIRAAIAHYMAAQEMLDEPGLAEKSQGNPLVVTMAKLISVVGDALKKQAAGG